MTDDRTTAHDQGGDADDAGSPGNPDWNRDGPEPSGWVAFCPDAECPGAAEVEAAVARWLGGEPEIRRAENPDERDEVRWAFALRVPSVDSEVVLWAERAASGSVVEAPELDSAIRRCPWVIRMQAVLGAEDPVADHFLLTTMLAGIVPDGPAIIDASSDAVFDRAELDAWYLHPQAKPLERLLWSIKGLTIDGDAGEEPRVIVRTKGLARCGRPELGIFEAPGRHLDAAVTLVHAVASLLLEGPMPARESAMEIGHGITVHLVRAEVETGEGPERVRETIALLCERGDDGTAGWSWPRRAIERVESGNAVLYLTSRTAEALREHARRSFPDFATAWAALHRSPDPALRTESEQAFRILAPVDPGGHHETPEHAWFRVDGFEGSLVRGVLLDAPHQRQDLHAGSVMLIAPELVRGWRADLGGRSFGPDDAPALLAEVDRLRGIG